MGHTFLTYTALLWTPTGLVFTIAIVIAVITVLCLLHNKVHRYSKACCVAAECKCPCRNFKVVLIKLILRDLSPEERMEGGTVKLYLDGREIYPIGLSLLFVASENFFCTALIAFWTCFLLDMSFFCDPTLDCFPLSKDTNEPLQQQPIKNCSEFELNHNVTIVCYQFALRYAEGVGAAGGVITFSSILVKLYSVMIFFFLNVRNKYINASIYKSAVILLLNLLPLIFIIVFILMVSLTIALRGLLHSDDMGWLLLFMFIFTVILVILSVHTAIMYGVNHSNKNSTTAGEGCELKEVVVQKDRCTEQVPPPNGTNTSTKYNQKRSYSVG